MTLRESNSNLQVDDAATQIDLARIKPNPSTYVATRRQVLKLQTAPVCFADSHLHALTALSPADALRNDATRYFQQIFGQPCAFHQVPQAIFRNWLRDWLPHFVGDPKTSSDGQSATTHSVESLIAIAHKLGATDIHLDPKPAQVSVRLRIDGGLADYSPFESQDYATVVNRIKVLAGLDIAETHTPQDGKFQHAFDNERLEVRVSVLPSQFGQRVALRLLPRGQTPPSLSQLGFTPTQQVEIRNAYNLPGGLIIVAGPTGSGKSTALFSMMSELLGGRDRCGLTVEDPVEYEIPGATQVSLGGELQLSFATALRTMLRHDPDVLMVGEIRDAETAQIATQAAMTGHLVLSTVHTQNVHGVRTRLVDLGVEEYLLNETLRLAIAGRLEALACGDCAGLGCLYCAGTGRSGRVGRFETLQFQPEQRLLPSAGGV